MKKSFNFTTDKTCKKYDKERCVDPTWRWMVQSFVNKALSRFEIYKYIGKHTCSIEHVTGGYKNVTVDVIALISLNFFIDNKGPNTKVIEMIVFRELRCKLGY